MRMNYAFDPYQQGHHLYQVLERQLRHVFSTIMEDKLGIENPIQISQNKKKRKKRTKGEQNFVFGNSPVVMFNLECNL